MTWVLRIAGVGIASGGAIVAWLGQAWLASGADLQRSALTLAAGAVAAAVAIAIAARSTAARVSWIGASAAWEAVAVAVLLGVGVWLRVAGFGEVPDGLNHDAAFNGMYAHHIRQGAEYTPYVSAAWGRETLFMYLVAATQIWFGGTVAAIESASIVAGLAALLPTYLLIRELLGRAAGIAGLAFFAASGWHWVFSRVGWRCVAVPPFEALALYFLWRSLRRGGIVPWVLTGAFTALSIYTYNAARVVPLMIGILALWHLLLHRDRWRSILAGGSAGVAAFVAVGGPMLWYAANNWVQFQGRAAHLSDQSAREVSLATNLVHALGMFNYRANGNDFFLTEPLLEPLAGVFFAVGAVLLLARLGRASSQFVLLGFLLSLVPGLLSFPNGNRGVTAMPFVYAMVGLGCAEIARLLASLLSGAAARWVMAAIVLACAAHATASTHRSYVSEERRLLRGLSPQATAVGEFLGRYGEDYRAYAVSDQWTHYTLLYLGYSHGNPLEPDIAIGRTFTEIEGRISRYGRRGLVLVADMSAAGGQAREAVKRLFADWHEESVRSAHLGGAEVARAVIVEPRAAARTATWSNQSRVLAISPGASSAGSGARCFEPRPTHGGLSLRFRLMVAELSPAAGGSLTLMRSCPGAADGGAVFTVSGEGILVDGPAPAVLVQPQGLEAGRWYDLGLSIDRRGVAVAMVDGRRVELGQWTERPDVLAGLAVAARGERAESPILYVDDVAVVSAAKPADSPWWQVAPKPGDEITWFENFEGLPLGDLRGRPGWHGEGIEWAIQPGPPGEETADVEHDNGFDGGHGQGPGQFDEPMGVGIDAAGNIYVSERLNHRVQKFAADGTYLGEWGVLGEKPGEFREPLDVAVDGDRLYVMDTWNTRLQVFDLTGNYLFQIGPDPVLGKPRGIFVRDGKVYIANSGPDNVLIYDTEGKPLLHFPPPETSTLKQIVDLVADSQGRIYVNNSQRNRIEVFSPAGERLGALDVAGWDSPHLKEFYMAIDDDDVIYVGDWDARRVRRFRVDGTELSPLGSQLHRPSGMALHGGRLVIAARGDHVLRAIELPASPAR